MRLLLDEMLSGAIAEQLRARGHDVVATVDQPTLRALPDAALLEAAREQDRTFVTYDRDYLDFDRALRAAGDEHSGIVLVTPHRFPQSQPATLGRLVMALDSLFEAPPAYPSFLLWLR